MDVIVVGGGIVGVACAEACSAAGLSVRLIEEERVGSGTTKAGMGHIMNVPGSLLPLTRYSQEIWRSRAPDWKGQIPIRSAGAVWLARTEQESRELDGLEKALATAGCQLERWDSPTLHEHEPAISRRVTEGLFVQDDLLIDPQATAVRLAALAQARKAELLEGIPVTSLTDDGIRLAEGTVMHAEHVVVAAGVGSTRLLPELGIRPRKGQIVHLATPQGYVRSQLGEVGYALGNGFEEEESVAFSAHPALSGGLWVGASRQNGVDSTEVDPALVERLLARAEAYLDDPRRFPRVRSWAGLRPASPDGLPFIGPWPGRPNLLVATGHEGQGFTTALGTGRLVADLLLGRPSEIDRRPYALEGRIGVPSVP